MSFIEKLILNFLILFFIFCLFPQPCFADDILNITIYELEPTVEILQGKCKSHPFEIYNAYNESVMIYYRIDEPSDMDIISSPDDYTLLESNTTTDGILYICVNESFENDTYNIEFWIETLTRVSGTGTYRKSNVRSDKYIIEVTVLNNPEITTTTIETTTSTISETTTSIGQVVNTTTHIPVTTTAGSFNIDIHKPKIGNLPGGENLGTVVVIAIALILIMIPYITFIKGRRAKTERG